MTDTPFFTPQWAQQFTAKHDLILLPKSAQLGFIAWQDLCQTPPCFLTDPADILGKQFAKIQQIFDAYRKLELIVSQMTEWLKTPINTKALPTPKRMTTTLDAIHQQSQIILQSQKRIANPWPQKIVKPENHEAIRKWIRNTFLACTKKMVHIARINHRLHLALLFQRQSLFLNQTPSYWRALTDKHGIQLLAQQARANDNTVGQSSQPKATVILPHVKQLQTNHQQAISAAKLPQKLYRDHKRIQCYQSILNDHPGIRTQAQRNLKALQQAGSCPSNKYQIMSHQQLILHCSTTQYMFVTTKLMRTQIISPSLSKRLWRKFKQSWGGKNNEINQQSSGNFPNPEINEVMLQDIQNKQVALQDEAGLILKTMLNRIMLCAHTQQFNGDDIFWHLHQQLDQEDLSLFDASPLNNEPLDQQASHAIFIRQSQSLKQLAELCYVIISFPEESRQVKKLQNQLRALPLIEALPHLISKPYKEPALIKIYYHEMLWTRIYQHSIALNQDDLLDLPTLYTIKQSLIALEDELSSTVKALGKTQQFNPAVKKAQQYVITLLDQLSLHCLQQQQRHQSEDYQQQLQHYVENIVDALINQDFDWVESQLMGFAESDISVVSTSVMTDQHQQFAQLHRHDLFQTIQKQLNCRLISMIRDIKPCPFEYQAIKKQLDHMQYCLNSAWGELGEACQKCTEQCHSVLILLAACNPWHQQSKEAVTKACKALMQANHTEWQKLIEPYLPASLGHVILHLATYHGYAHCDHHGKLLAFCGLDKAEKEYRDLLSRPNKAWLKKFAHRWTTPSIDRQTECELADSLTPSRYPAISQLIQKLHLDDLHAHTDMEDIIHYQHLLMESLCTMMVAHIDDYYQSTSISDLEPNDDLLEFNRNDCTDALIALIHSFSLTTINTLEQYHQAICLWISNHASNETQEIDDQLWLLGTSKQDAPLNKALYLAIKQIILFLSQIKRSIAHYNNAPLSQQSILSLEDDLAKILHLAIPIDISCSITQSFRKKIEQIMPKLCRQSLLDEKNPCKHHIQYSSKLFSMKGCRKSRESADKPGSVEDSHLSRRQVTLTLEQSTRISHASSML